jgi:hypothetical protein
VELILKQLESLQHNLTKEEKRYAFQRLLKHHEAKDLLPNYVRNEKMFKVDRGMLESMKVAYNMLVGKRLSQHLTFKNVLLSSMVYTSLAKCLLYGNRLVYLFTCMFDMSWSYLIRYPLMYWQNELSISFMVNNICSQFLELTYYTCPICYLSIEYRFH